MIGTESGEAVESWNRKGIAPAKTSVANKRRKLRLMAAEGDLNFPYCRLLQLTEKDKGQKKGFSHIARTWFQK